MSRDGQETSYSIYVSLFVLEYEGKEDSMCLRMYIN